MEEIEKAIEEIGQIKEAFSKLPSGDGLDKTLIQIQQELVGLIEVLHHLERRVLILETSGKNTLPANSCPQCGHLHEFSTSCGNINGFYVCGCIYPAKPI
jgi:hypothetical protein